MNQETRECVVVATGIFCNCGGLMSKSGPQYMSNPPQQKMECKFCGNTEVVLASESGTVIELKTRGVG